MGALAKLFSCSDKILAVFFLKVLTELLRLMVLAICILWKHYRHLSTSYKYASTINKRTSKFAYNNRRKAKLAELVDQYCSICLSEFAEGDVGREIVDCKHAFHGDCLEKWLQHRVAEARAATCPLCRRLVVPEVIVAEYHKMQIEKENSTGIIEKELALILLKYWWN